jgi:ATP-binding cassette subfamily B protein
VHSVKEGEPAKDPDLPIHRQLLKVLDTPVQEFFRKQADRKGDPRSPTTSEPTLAQSRLFEPLIQKEKKISSERKVEFDRLAGQVSFSDCVLASIKWAWKAGSSQVISRAVVSISNALLPYAVSIAGTKTIDALVGISQNPNAERAALLWFGVSAGLGLLSQGASLFQRWVEAKHSVGTKQEMLRDIRNKLVEFTPEEQMKPEVTQMVTRTLQSQYAMQNFGQALFQTAVPVVAAAGACGIIATYSPLAAVVLASFSLPYLYHAWKEGKERLEVANDIQEPLNRLGSREWGMLTGEAQLDLKLLQKGSELNAHIDHEVQEREAKQLEPTLRSIRRAAWMQPLNTVAVTTIGFTVLLDAIATAKGAPGQEISVGAFGLVLGALYSLNGSVRSFAVETGRMIIDLPVVKLAHGILHKASKGQSESIIAALENAPAWSHPPFIEVNNLRFRYPATDAKEPIEVLKGLTFRVNSGEMLGIVGDSGSGKSTLVKILSKIYAVENDAIKFDGKGLGAMPSQELWRNSAHLRQQGGNLYSMTIRENIKIGARENISDDEILALAEASGFKEIMDEDGLTLDTVLGQWFEGGKNLSGGQHTLLALTRIKAAGGKFLMLDEPTAALDQRRVASVLEKLRGLNDVTRIVIAHDFGVARHADRILVLNSGEVEDIGTHDELLSRCATYQKGYNNQLNRLMGIQGPSVAPKNSSL